MLWRRLLLASLLPIACTPSERSDETVGRSEETIVNGALDVTHQAVVAWLFGGGKCSATIVAVVGGTGYALTAAHCVGGGLGNLYQGNDFNNPAAVYPVVDAQVHPGYAQAAAFDFAMLTFTGANGSTPVIAPLTKAQDNINVGTFLEPVGYGFTENGDTSQRHHITLPVATESHIYLSYDQSGGGICFGDSGGSSLLTQAMVPYAAGVHSSVSSNNCVEPGADGFDVRVSSVVDTFINPYINGQPYGQQTCDECTDANGENGACTPAIQTCFADAECSAYVDCYNMCPTQACVVQCGGNHPSGKQLYDQIVSCFCSTACSAECVNDPLCIPPPPCGIDANDPECNTCFGANCCAQGQACAADPVCLDCFTSITPGPECDTNPATIALSDCLGQNCGTECNLGTGQGGAGVGGSGGGGGSFPDTSSSTGVAVTGAGGGNPDDGKKTQVIDQGCGCRTARSSSDRGAVVLLLLGALALRRRPHHGPRGRRHGSGSLL